MAEFFWFMVFVTIIIVSGMVIVASQLEGRRQHRLKLTEAERGLIEARTKELAEQNRRMELEYRQAQGELERFDRGGARHLGATPQE
jgi:hypothetical protein